MKEHDVLRKELSAPLPPEAVKPHPTKTYLSSIKAIFVTERLNTVFGIGKWTQKVEHITTTDKGMVVVKVTFEVPEYGIYYESFGGNDNGGDASKNFDLGDAYKGATTDAITKIGSYLEIGIDVFKGLKNEPQKPQAPLPALNPMDKDKWSKAVQYLAKDGKIEEIKEKYYLSPENEQKLMDDSLLAV